MLITRAVKARRGFIYRFRDFRTRGPRCLDFANPRRLFRQLKNKTSAAKHTTHNPVPTRIRLNVSGEALASLNISWDMGGRLYLTGCTSVTVSLPPSLLALKRTLSPV